MLDFRNWNFHRLTFVCVRLCLLTRISSQSDNMEQSSSQKKISVWRLSAILNLGISEFFLRFRRLSQNLCLHTKFRHIRTFRG